MEILLLGNGFDLEHKLPTTYKDFLEFCKYVRDFFRYINLPAGITSWRSDMLHSNMNPLLTLVLLDAFNERECEDVDQIIKVYKLKNSPSNILLRELSIHVENNVWIEYFLSCSSYIGENWIDFEAEISRVIQMLDSIRTQISHRVPMKNIAEKNNIILLNIAHAKLTEPEEIIKNLDSIDEFSVFLNNELGRLTRALEIYIAYFIQNINIIKKSIDIERLNPDYVLSFNYSNTYERTYGKEKNICYNYIHGKAFTENTIESCNLVLGIDEYLNDDRKDVSLEFLSFKKYYQRIYKSTDNSYLDWLHNIKYRKDNIPHTLYIFGHSLDVTDKDVLKLFICNDNIKTKIYYHRKNEYDKTTLAKLIKNLIKIIGQEELIRRTGGSHKTIEFIPQTI